MEKSHIVVNTVINYLLLLKSLALKRTVMVYYSLLVEKKIYLSYISHIDGLVYKYSRVAFVNFTGETENLL